MNLLEFAQQFATCPCCCESVECLPDCDHADNAPEAAETMQAAREAIRSTEASPTQQERSQGPGFVNVLRAWARGAESGVDMEMFNTAAKEVELLHREIDRLRAELETWHRSVLEAQVPKRRKETNQ